MVFRMVDAFFSRTDIRISRTAGSVNLVEPEGNGGNPVLSIV